MGSFLPTTVTTRQRVVSRVMLMSLGSAGRLDYYLCNLLEVLFSSSVEKLACYQLWSLNILEFPFCDPNQLVRPVWQWWTDRWLCQAPQMNQNIISSARSFRVRWMADAQSPRQDIEHGGSFFILVLLNLDDHAVKYKLSIVGWYLFLFFSFPFMLFIRGLVQVRELPWSKLLTLAHT